MLSSRKENILHLLQSYSFNQPIDLLRQFTQRVDELERAMSSGISHRMAMRKAQGESLGHRIAALDPRLTLKRGYTIVYKNGAIVSTSRALQSEDAITVKFHDGDIRSTVD